MPLLFDTNIVSLYRSGDQTIRNKVKAIPVSERFLSDTTVLEILRGYFAVLNVEQDKGQKGKANNTVRAYASLRVALDYISGVLVLPYNERAEAIFQSYPADIKRGKGNDCRIAATAAAHDMPVVTRNRHDFEKIPGARITEW